LPSDGGSAAQEAQRLRHRAGRHWTQSAHAVPCPESSRGELPRGHDWVSGDAIELWVFLIFPGVRAKNPEVIEASLSWDMMRSKK